MTCTVAGLNFNITVRGTVLAKIEPVNKKTNRFTLTLTGSNGVPTRTEYENNNGNKEFTKLEVQYKEEPWRTGAVSFGGLWWELSEVAAEIQG
jgi:antitoxin (DNA-binding transcriptional repressor) of toxin-antitoxin stability system